MWSASQPLMVQLPSRFDLQIRAGSEWWAGQRPKNYLNDLFSHYKAVEQNPKAML
jgi:hypothetical protein